MKTFQVKVRCKGKVVTEGEVTAESPADAVKRAMTGEGIDRSRIKADQSYVICCGDALASAFGDEFELVGRFSSDDKVLESGHLHAKFGRSPIEGTVEAVFPHIPKKFFGFDTKPNDSYVSKEDAEKYAKKFIDNYSKFVHPDYSNLEHLRAMEDAGMPAIQELHNQSIAEYIGAYNNKYVSIRCGCGTYTALLRQSSPSVRKFHCRGCKNMAEIEV